MFEVTIIQDFAAAHRLYEYPGECANLHGHTWQVKVCARSQELNKDGMVIDFKELKSYLKSILQRFDHGLINEQPPFATVNPTAENIAREIYREIKPFLTHCTLHRVEVWESAGSCAAYWEE